MMTRCVVDNPILVVCVHRDANNYLDKTLMFWSRIIQYLREVLKYANIDGNIEIKIISLRH